ncbi:tRNA uracil 4-sulfurtransferase ThiI [Candidatus Nitronereus thalassa]|uniref:Probable tRNA sulfurtransferase n=1 Tax=Candidatus Nitronereus thalassa TaxID=3020898 RepID=A0ABU3K3X5_9BACT|nr:tRNA uracil 4-sulfurtransferase ThiI [Candidatus Nitronereus thalassa]MDT7041063.1 tRNA 4-thiouridine(8) synthase ThiI [Candidatus Nitronereus thalassa]
MPCALVHYHELALKGGNRKFFIQRMVQHLRNSLRHHNGIQVDSLPGRVKVSFQDGTPWTAIEDGIRHTFGVVNYSLAYSLPIDYGNPDLQPLCKAIEAQLPTQSFHTFRVTTKRADKRFPHTSVEVNREVGAYLHEITGKPVQLHKPDLTIFIEIVDHTTYFSLNRQQGPGGLPTGMSGKVVCLLSGGIDSPVAAYRMMKRGCKVTFVHFHGRPYLSRASEEKVRDLAKHLTRYQLYSRLFLIPFGEIQRQIVLDSPAPIRVVLYRRMMMRIADHIAEKEQAWGLVTGDSLGQVASQTAENIQVVSEIPKLPILRPLIGMDKIEITNESQQIGTFDTSIEPDQDCCTLFVPPHPNTKCRSHDICKAEEGLAIQEMVEAGLKNAELVEFSC